jgi:hypothetical protein
VLCHFAVFELKGKPRDSREKVGVGKFAIKLIKGILQGWNENLFQETDPSEVAALVELDTAPFAVDTMSPAEAAIWPTRPDLILTSRNINGVKLDLADQIAAKKYPDADGMGK